MKNLLIAAATAFACSPAFAQTTSSAPAAAQAAARSVTAGPSATPAIGLGLAALPSVAGETAASVAATAFDTAASRVIPSVFSPQKVCVFNFGVQMNGPTRNAHFVNVDNAHDLNLSCR